ncbi:protein IWS1 homolog [Hoplias malabaricus]|uniref:protein IWS1 homolog n=1 Tax=Hoplias malabaricus TaxID=27720 RepID=UPI003462D90A
MESLVVYGASDSDSEENSQTEQENDSKREGRGGEQKPRNFLLELGSESSSESESEERDDDQEESPEAVSPSGVDSSSETPPPLTFSSLSSKKLPPPPLGGSGSGGLPAGSSVFANPFKERAEERLSCLQKHVPLTAQARPSQIGGKRMCVAYRKDGRCRFGIRCKFAHDSDLQSRNGPSPPTSHASDCGGSDAERVEGDEREEGQEEDDGRKRKKHKVGISDSLIPPKRALKQYAVQKDGF